jgi:hypothetical protein
MLLWVGRIFLGVGCVLALTCALYIFIILLFRADPFWNPDLLSAALIGFMSVTAFLLAGGVQVLLQIEENTRQATKMLNHILERMESNPSEPTLKDTSVISDATFRFPSR